MKVADWLLALPREARIIVVAGGTTIAVALIFLLGAIAEYTLEGAQRIGATEPRVARLLGYESVSADLIAGAKRASIALQARAYPASIERRAGPLLQQDLRRFASEAGLTVTGSQLVVSEEPREDLPGFLLIAVNLTFEGPPMALDAFLTEVEAHSPSLAISSLEMQKSRVARRSQVSAERLANYLTMSATVLALEEDAL